MKNNRIYNTNAPVPFKQPVAAQVIAADGIRLVKNKLTGYFLILLGLLFLMVLMSLFSSCKKKETEVVPVPAITSINKNLLNIGDTLIIKGENFNTDPSQNLVSVADIAFNVVKASSTQLLAIVPKGAQSGNLTVGFKQGQSVTYSQVISIIGSTTPVIKSISPAAGAYETDTVVIRGSNFAIPYNTNSITFNGVAGTIYNVTDTLIRVVVPLLASSGPVQITTNGVNSPTFQYTIQHVDPTVDGHIYWMAPSASYSYQTGTYSYDFLFMKGITNTATPQTTVINDDASSTGFWQTNPNPYGPNYDSYADGSVANGYQIDNFIINDAQDKYGYFLTESMYPFPGIFSMMRMTLSGTATKPVSVWNQTYTTPAYTRYAVNPTDTIDYPPVYVHYTPDEVFTADGNTAYIKMGLSDDYLEGDLSAASPTFTLHKNVFGDPEAYEPKFGKSYVFFQEIGPRYQGDPNPDYIAKIRYAARGSKTMTDIPLQLRQGEVLVNTLADAAHGDTLLIVTNYDDPNTQIYYNTIYRFNADTKKLTTLYDYHNWPDATNFQPYSGSTGNSGFAWLGSHIYYSTTRHTPPNQSSAFSALYRINDNGIPAKLYPVYGRMEPLSLAYPASKWAFFLGQ